MALTLTVTDIRRGKFVGGKKFVLATIDMTGSYAGKVLTAAMFGLMTLDNLIFLDNCTSSGHIPQYTRSTKTLKLWMMTVSPTHSAVFATNTAAGGGADVRVMAIGV